MVDNTKEPIILRQSPSPISWHFDVGPLCARLNTLDDGVLEDLADASCAPEVGGGEDGTSPSDVLEDGVSLAIKAAGRPIQAYESHDVDEYGRGNCYYFIGSEEEVLAKLNSL